MNFDYVVIGSGAGGAATARRLSDDPEVDVLLIESGDDVRPDAVAVPAMWPVALGSEVDWNYVTVPQPALADRPIAWPRGRLMGGTTCLNAMIHSHPKSGELAAIGEGWDDLMVRRVVAEIESSSSDTAGRGHAGPVATRPAVDPSPFCQSFIDASVSAGFPFAPDLNAVDDSAVGWFDLNIDADGQRADAASAYVRPVVDRPNLVVRASTHVARLVLRGGAVVGLEVETHGVVDHITVTGEVVLAAGVVGSPTLLLRSGIGDRDELQECGIELQVDLPAVGKGLQDHVAFPMIWAADDPIKPPTNQWFESNLRVVDDTCTNGRTVSVAFGHTAALLPDNPPEHGGCALIGLYDTNTRGSIRLDPQDPSRPVLIDPAYLSDPSDVAALRGAIRLVRSLVASEPVAPFGLTELVPGPGDSDDHLDQMIRVAGMPFFHGVGTCAAGSVVDERLRVIGVENLVIADGSVFPAIPSVATSVAIQVVGWRAAELLLEERAVDL